MKHYDPAAYADTLPVWQTALEKGELTLIMTNTSQAVKFAQRCNIYRTALRQRAHELSPIPGYFPQTPYDQLIISRDGNRLHFHPRSLPVMQIIGADGRPVKLTTTISIPDPFE